MQEPLNEKISLLIDDELDSEQALSMLNSLQDDLELKAKLQRYQLIGQVLRNEECFVLDTDFANKIHQQLRQEPIYFLPSSRARINWQKAGLAIAASVVLGVVWLVGQHGKPGRNIQSEMAMVAPLSVQPIELNPHFNDYLQAHENGLYVQNVPRMQPYTQVVGYQQE